LLQLWLDTQTFLLRQKHVLTSCHSHECLITQAIRDGQRPNQGKEYDRPWKIKTVFETFNQAYAKFYNPLEHLAVDKVIVKFKGRFIFRQYISKKRERFDIRIYKLRAESGYTHDMRVVYLGRDSRCDSDDMSATHTWRLVSQTITRKLTCVNSAGVCVCV
jgi:hypothetical protein